MRKEKKEYNAATTARINGYHGGNFDSYKYFTSDRVIKLNERFERPDGKPLLGYGLEIETECFGKITDSNVLTEVFESIIFKHFPDDLFKLERDGSLGGDSSAECITQIMTKERIRNLYGDFKNMFNVYFKAFQISASKTGKCGMHVNLSNGLFGTTEEIQSDNIRKLLYFVNRHYDFCLPLFSRNENHTYYCSRMYQYATKENAKNADLYHMPSSHGNCFNGSHFPQGRIELRIVGGQKDFACFRNTMEVVFFLISRLKKLSWNDLDDLSKVFKGCNQYVYDRLKTKCFEAGQISVEQLQKILPTVVQEEYI